MTNWFKAIKLLSRTWWGPYRKAKKWALWEITYWKRKDQPDTSEKHWINKYYSYVISFAFEPEEIWYKGKDAHIVANSIFKSNIDKIIDADMVCISVKFFNEAPEFEDMESTLLKKLTSKHHFSGKKHWFYPLTK